MDDDFVLMDTEQPEQLPAKREQRTAPEKQETREQRLSIADVISDPALSSPAGLEILATANPALDQAAANDRLDQMLKSYGMQPEELASEKREQLLLLAASSDKARSRNTRQEMGALIQRKLHEQLVNMALLKIDDLGEQLHEKKHDPQTVEAKLRDFMDTLGRLSKQLPAEDRANAAFWEQIEGHYVAVIMTKKSAGKEVSRVMSRIFDEFADFIEDEILSREIERKKNKAGYFDYEEIAKYVYGRTPEEMEEQKTRNRERVAAAMEDMSDKPYVTTDMLLELYKINNRGIAAREMQRLRQGPDEKITFVKRMGIMPEDLPEEMTDWEQRVAGVCDQALLENWSDSRYQIAVTQLHNEFLEIHPFPDRNGSTGVMFMELMMMRRGYRPSRQRQKDYYSNVSKILGYNPVAVGVIGYEMARQRLEWGYFPGKTTKGKEEKYNEALTGLSGGEYKPRPAVQE